MTISWQLWVKISLLFRSTSGHTVRTQVQQRSFLLLQESTNFTKLFCSHVPSRYCKRESSCINLKTAGGEIFYFSTFEISHQRCLLIFFKRIFIFNNFLFHNSHDKLDRQIITSNKINQIES